MPAARIPLIRRSLPILALWCALSGVLAVLATRVADWFAMPNEMLYERRAISIADTLVPLPRVRGELVQTYDQLYSLLVAPAFLTGYVPDDLWQVHFLNAWIMASACIPTFLLARQVTGRLWAAYVTALLSVGMPWILFSSFVLTEVAAYPAFMWTMLALQRATVSPSRRNDVLALLGLALAFVARTQFASLVFLLPCLLVAYELGRARGVRRALRASVAAHRLLAVAYALMAALALVLLVAGRLPSVLGVYGATIGSAGSSVDDAVTLSGLGGSFVEHVALFALGLGILPLLVGFAWLFANLVRPRGSPELHAFACLGALTVAVLFVQVTVFDLRFGAGYVHDRYLFYLVPLVVLAVLCALEDVRRPRWSLVPPTALTALGFAFGALPGVTWERFPTVNSDAPISTLIRPAVRLADGLDAARVALAVTAIVLAALFVQGAALLRRTHLTAIVAGFMLVALPSLTAYMYVRLFEPIGWSGRPLTERPAPPYDWVDRAVHERGKVAMVPYPVTTDYFVNQRIWRDYEFWNKSVERDVQQRDQTFIFTPDTYGKIYPRFDPETGLSVSDDSPTRFVLHANQESRFRVAGPIVVAQPDAMLIEAAEPWRLEWLTFGLYADGWTQPGVVARVRIFAAPDQRGDVTRTLGLGLRSPEDVAERPAVVTSNLERWTGRVAPQTVRASLRVCVPAGGYADVRLAVQGSSTIPGDLRDIGLGSVPRDGGVFVVGIALADELEPGCPRG